MTLRTSIARTPTLACIGHADPSLLERGLATEWLETDGLGGFASSTVLLCPTRRYHGLLVSRPAALEARHVFLTRFEETVHAPGASGAISMARYPGATHPEGWRTLERFELVPYPSWTHRVGEGLIQRELLVVQGLACTLLRYRALEASAPLELELRPLFACRAADELTFENDVARREVERADDGLAFRPYEALPAVHLALGRVPHRFDVDAVWYRDIEYVEDARRGYPAREDQLSPGILRLVLAEGDEIVIAISLGARAAHPLALWSREARRRKDRLEEVAREPRALVARCELAADDFLFRAPRLERRASGGRRLAVNAGFPWFGEWGRDAFLALPGLTLARERIEDCADALSGALDWLDDGLLPNVFGASRATSRYNSVDAALWFARCVRLYELAGGSSERLFDEYAPAMTAIADAYAAGSAPRVSALGVRVDAGGLIEAGSAEANATWMDAVVATGPVTPRHGCAVEVNALWYALLAHLEELAGEMGDARARGRWSDLRRRARKSFLERFWLADERYLADVWRADAADRSVRPNMVIAAALEHSPLSREMRAGVVEKARAELLTPRGLRTLSPRDPAYRGTYGGSQAERDAAYHQGTVWPWLLGFHCEASLRAFGARRGVRRECLALWEPFLVELDRVGLNHVSEVFDGDAPHLPGGTIAQAWNTGELLRAHALCGERA
jgi:predicted glycogen debranching enzyme